MKTDSAVRPVRLPVVWKDSPGVSEKQLRLRQSFQSARPIKGSPCGPRFCSTWWNERFRCSKSVAAFFGSLSKGTVSRRIAKSPDSLMYAAVPEISHSGSSLKPEPTSLLPRLVSGWYWW